MKLQAHMPTVSVGEQDWRAAKIVLVSLFVAAALLLTLQSGVFLDNLEPESLPKSSVARPPISVAHRVSLDLHWSGDPIDKWTRFSVAHQLPANVASSQPFSIAIDQRVAFEVFGEATLHDLLANKRSERQLRPHNDRVLLMLMLLRLHTRRS
jgi:hypothetical protein